MKISTKTKEMDTNIDVQESVDFGIDKENEAVIIDILRNKLYSHKIRTLVQEYMSNARDANREVGQTNPILVHFPTSESPDFWVRDYGPGLSSDRIAKVFVKYGNSTKRDTNTQTGGFGIGAKSAWSYTDSFIIESYYDGMKTVYNAQIADNNLGRLDKIAEHPTAEPSGVKVVVGVRQSDIREFGRCIQRASVYWDAHEFPNFINSNGWNDQRSEVKAARQRFFGLGFNNLADDVNLHPTGDYGIVVVDGIPFENNLVKIIDQNPSRNTIFVPNGLITVSASRESLEDKKENVAVLQKLANNIKNKFLERKEEIDKTSDYDFVMKHDGKMASEAGVHFPYDGKFIRSHHGSAFLQDADKHIRYSVFGNGHKLAAKKMDNVYYSLSYDDCVSKARHKRFLDHYGHNSVLIKVDFRERTTKISPITLQQCATMEVNESARKEFVDFIVSLGAKDFEEFYKKIPKKPRSITGTTQKRTGHPFYIPGNKKSFRPEDFPDDKIFILFNKKHSNCEYYRKLGYECVYTKSQKAYDGLIGLKKNFHSLEDFYKNVYKPTDAQAVYLFRDHGMDRPFDNLEALRLNLRNDPDIPSDLKKCFDLIGDYRKIIRTHMTWEMRKIVKESDKYKQLVGDSEFCESIIKKIPLLGLIRTYSGTDAMQDFKEYLFSKLGK